MKHKQSVRAIAALSMSALLVLLGASSAVGAANGGTIGPCGGPTFPTLQYRHATSFTEASWRTSRYGTYLRGPAQYSPNTAVYFASPTQQEQYGRVAYGDNTSFSYFNRYCA